MENIGKMVKHYVMGVLTQRPHNTPLVSVFYNKKQFFLLSMIFYFY